MKRTELREAFFAEARVDPYLHAITHQVANAWAHGYERALKDVVASLESADATDAAAHVTDLLRRVRFDERHERALEWITEERRRAEVERLVALAALGPIAARP